MCSMPDAMGGVKPDGKPDEKNAAKPVTKPSNVPIVPTIGGFGIYDEDVAK